MPGVRGWCLPALGGKGETAAVLQPDAARMLGAGCPPPESPAADDQYLLVLSEAAFQGKITHRARNVAGE